MAQDPPVSRQERILYLDAASGVAGDMLLGALLDLGPGMPWLRSRLEALRLPRWTITERRVTRGGFGARHVTVKASGRQEHRGLREIRALFAASALEPPVRAASLAVFERIVREEARIHRIPASKVHLHEVGAVDAILDVVGTVLLLREVLGDGRMVCSPLNVGSGSVEMEHGRLPVPAPATAALLKGVPIYSAGPPFEMVTPTGAALVSTLSSSFGPPPAMIVERLGYGAGTREIDGHPNVVRAMLGRPWPAASRSAGEVAVLECTIDDMNPQGYGYLMERLTGCGALEVFYLPAQMKKNRPGVLVTVVCAPDRVSDLARVVFEETTTIGLRHRTCGRIELARAEHTVPTSYGKVRLKVSSLDGRIMQVQPEYEDCRRLASRRKVPLKLVQTAALAAWGDRGA